MDEIDFRILGHLLQHPLAGPQELAKTVGLTRNAVARRMRRLQEADVRLSVLAYPHQDLFALGSTVHLYHAVRGPKATDILACDGVLAFDQNHDGIWAVTIWHPPGQGRSAALDALFGAPPVASFTDATPGPAVPHLSRLEWKVVAALLEHPRGTAAALARASGLAPRTCQRARDRLVTSRAVRVATTLCEDHAEGLPIFRLYVQGHPVRNEVGAILGADALVTDEVDEGAVYFARAASLGAIMGAVERVRKLPGVEEARLILSRSAGVSHAFLRGLVQARMSGA